MSRFLINLRRAQYLHQRTETARETACIRSSRAPSFDNSCEGNMGQPLEFSARNNEPETAGDERVSRLMVGNPGADEQNGLWEETRCGGEVDVRHGETMILTPDTKGSVLN